jgi:hypothetical protein
MLPQKKYLTPEFLCTILKDNLFLTSYFNVVIWISTLKYIFPFNPLSKILFFEGCFLFLLRLKVLTVVEFLSICHKQNV